MVTPVMHIDKAVSDQDKYTKTIYGFLESIGINISTFLRIILLLIAFLFKWIFVFLQKTLHHISRCNLIKNIRIDFCNKYQHMNYSYYTNARVGFVFFDNRGSINI